MYLCETTAWINFCTDQNGHEIKAQFEYWCRSTQNKGKAEFSSPQFVTHCILLTYCWKCSFQTSALAYDGHRYIYIGRMNEENE